MIVGEQNFVRSTFTLVTMAKKEHALKCLYGSIFCKFWYQEFVHWRKVCLQYLMDFYRVLSRKVCLRSSRPDGYNVKRPSLKSFGCQGGSLSCWHMIQSFAGKSKLNACILFNF
jgi:hypothetical protein